MGGPSKSPRFRIRLEDGDELPIGSVEALARRVARGDVSPETELFDASTGAWLVATKAAVVRFILDEIERAGGDLPDGWGSQGVSGSDPGLEAPDPFALGLTLAPPSDEEQLEGSSDEVGLEDPEAEPALTAAGKTDWVTPASAGGLMTPAAPPAPTEAPSASSSSFPPTAADRTGPRPPGKRRNWVWVSSFSALGVALVIAGLFLGGASNGPAEVDAGDGEGTSTLIDPPTGAESTDVLDLLEPAIREQAETGAIQRYRLATDSLRVALGIPDAPPEEWLGGYYLANANEFPSVPDFWTAYRSFVDEMTALDDGLSGEIVRAGLESSGVDSAQETHLQTYLEDLYENGIEEREGLYEQLGSVAEASLTLHAFLLEEREAIRFTPAVGAGAVPSDPVLEVGTDDPEVGERLETHLDNLFESLAGPRGGGGPSLMGLSEELFGRFVPF